MFQSLYFGIPFGPLAVVGKIWKIKGENNAQEQNFRVKGIMFSTVFISHC